MAAPQITDRALRYRAQKNAPRRHNPDDPNESVQDKTWREWAENYQRVQAHPEKASEKDLRRALNYLDHARGSMLRRAQESGRRVDANVLQGYDTDYEYFVSLIKKRERRNSGVKAATRGVLKQYDRATGLIGTVTSLPRKFVGSLVGERNPKRKRKGNPPEQAKDMYEAFHGKPAESQVVVKEEFHKHEHLATLGVLVNFWVAPVTQPGKGVCIETSDADRDFDEVGGDADTVFLAANEDGTQLYFVGGDQSLDLDALKFKGDWVKDSMVIGVIYELTYRTRKKFDEFKLTEYYHELGEETGDQPMLVYDSLSPHCFISGGKYKIKMPLIGMSPGIEN